MLDAKRCLVGLCVVVGLAGCAVETNAPVDVDDPTLDPQAAAATSDPITVPDSVVYNGCTLTAQRPHKSGNQVFVSVKFSGTCANMPLGVCLAWSPNLTTTPVRVSQPPSQQYCWTTLNTGSNSGTITMPWPLPTGIWYGGTMSNMTGANAYTHVTGGPYGPYYWSRACFGSSCPGGPDIYSCPVSFDGAPLPSSCYIAPPQKLTVAQ